MSFTDNDHLVIGHHRKPARMTYDRAGFKILPVKNGLVKSFFGLSQHMVSNIITDFVDEIGFLTHQKVDGMVDFFLQIAYDFVKSERHTEF